MTSSVSPEMTLAQAQDWLREQLPEGADCPCCTQLAKIYRRKINSSMAYALITFYRAHALCWGHAPSTGDISKLGGDWGQLRRWGLIEELTVPRDDGGRAGWWRVTEAGRLFVYRAHTVPKYVRLYDGKPMGFDGPEVDILDALGTKFNYYELMAGVW